MWGFIYAGAFLAAFAASALFKMTYDPTGGKYTVQWDGTVGTIHRSEEHTSELQSR